MSENHTDVEANTEGVHFLDSKEGAGDTQNDLVTTNYPIELQHQSDNVETEKNVETVIDILTEKQIDPVIAGRTKQFWVYFSDRDRDRGRGRRRRRRRRHSDDYDDHEDEYVTYVPGRNDFVRKVFMIAFVMLAATAGGTAWVYIARPPFIYHEFVPFFMIGCIGTAFAVSCIYSCCDFGRYSPCNWLLCILAVAAYTGMSAILCLRYAPFIILAAVVSTTAVTGLCLGLAYTSIDFTKCYLVVGAGIFAVFVASVVLAVLSKGFGYDIKPVRLIIAVAAAAVTAVMMVIEFQMILGGQSLELTEDMYVYGAYLVYSSIISLFLKLLAILAEVTGDKE